MHRWDLDPPTWLRTTICACKTSYQWLSWSWSVYHAEVLFESVSLWSWKIYKAIFLGKLLPKLFGDGKGQGTSRANRLCEVISWYQALVWKSTRLVNLDERDYERVKERQWLGCRRRSWEHWFWTFKVQESKSGKALINGGEKFSAWEKTFGTQLEGGWGEKATWRGVRGEQIWLCYFPQR